MAVQTAKLGPGTLTLGPVATPLDFSCQLLNAQVENDKSKDDDETTLCGDVVAGEVEYSFTLTGTFFQDLASATGIVAYSWEHMGEAVEFEYVPNTVAAASVAGTLTIDPLIVGGDEPKKNMRSDFTWDIVGTPTFTPGTGTTLAAEAEADTEAA